MQAEPYQDGTGQWWDWDGTQYVPREPGAPDPTPTRVPMGPPPPVPPTPTPTPPPTTTTGGTGGGAVPPGSMGTLGPFVPPSERFSVSDWMGGQPIFAPDRFSEPDPETAMRDPSYQFELGEGMKALQQSAAARGVLNGGGTLKDINAWGQNYATSRIADVRNRAISSYQLNYQAALDAFTGRMNGWQTRGQVGQRQNEMDWTHAYTPWNDNWNRATTIATA